MKIIISPSKTQDKSLISNHSGREMISENKTRKLFDLIRTYSIENLSKLMNIKNNLLEDTYQTYQQPLRNDNKKLAIQLYQGVVFEQIKLSDYSTDQTQFMNDNLIILSAMYGPLTSDTMIWPYRLDMTMKPNGINLYEYWQETIDNFFDDEFIINLASKEFSHMLKNHKNQMITIDFKNRLDSGKLRTVSYHAKKARGMMVNEIITQKIEDVETLKGLNINGYQYDDIYSNEKKLIFVK